MQAYNLLDNSLALNVIIVDIIFSHKFILTVPQYFIPSIF